VGWPLVLSDLAVDELSGEASLELRLPCGEEFLRGRALLQSLGVQLVGKLVLRTLSRKRMKFVFK
jgi:hypothetical protein